MSVVTNVSVYVWPCVLKLGHLDMDLGSYKFLKFQNPCVMKGGHMDLPYFFDYLKIIFYSMQCECDLCLLYLV